MQNQNDKIIWWILGEGLIFNLLLIPELLIAKYLSKNDSEAFRSYVSIILFITAIIYIVISVIKLVKYQKCTKKYDQEKVEKISKN